MAPLRRAGPGRCNEPAITPGDPLVRFAWRSLVRRAQRRNRQGNLTRGSPGAMAVSLRRPELPRKCPSNPLRADQTPFRALPRHMGPWPPWQLPWSRRLSFIRDYRCSGPRTSQTARRRITAILFHLWGLRPEVWWHQPSDLSFRAPVTAGRHPGWDRQANFTRGSPGVMAASLQRPGPARRNGAAAAVGDPLVKFPWRCRVTGTCCPPTAGL